MPRTLTLKGSVTGSFTLSDTEGSVTTFAKPGPAATTWQVSTALLDGLSNSTTKVVSETVPVAGKTLARPKRIIAPTSAVTAAACEADSGHQGLPGAGVRLRHRDHGDRHRHGRRLR